MTTAVGVLAGGHDEALPALTEVVQRQRRDLPGLLEAARDGDADAFAAIVRRFQRPIYRLVLRMVRRPAVADDLSQDVFIRLWRHLSGVGAQESQVS